MILAGDRNINVVNVCGLIGMRNQAGRREGKGHEAHGSSVDFLFKNLQKPTQWYLFKTRLLELRQMAILTAREENENKERYFTCDIENN